MEAKVAVRAGRGRGEGGSGVPSHNLAVPATAAYCDGREWLMSPRSLIFFLTYDVRF